MATTPRAGIINLNFKDVSEMAKNIADNDPWKLGIDAAGKVLTDRERYIMYQRALADAEKRERPEDKTAGELIGSGIETAGDALSWLKDKWDRLDIRSPFEETLTEGTKTESPITETASEKGSREMIGYKPNQSPIETDKYRTNLKAPGRANVEPNDELSFGFNRDVGQGEENASPIIPFATGEQTPEQIGVKVDYGTSEPKPDYTKLRSPFAMREKAEESEAVAPEKAQESGSPFEATEVAETKIKAPRMSEMEAWSEMNRLDPQRAAFDYNRVKTEADKKKVEKEKTQSLLKEVASDFANFDPTDQASWTEARDRWIDINPNLASFIPEQASQDAWDRIQTQGGLGKNVAPKGEFAQRKYLEDQVKQATFLSTTARASGKYDEADFYANKALTIQKQLDGRTEETGKTVDQILLEYKADIDELLKSTTKDDKADTSVLFAKISGDIGEGAKLTAVEAAIDKKLEDKRLGRSTATDYSDSELKTQADTYKQQATKLVEDKPKILGAIQLIQKGINSGAAGMASKTLQGDVLAEAEIARYISGDEYAQWKNKIRQAVKLNPVVRAELVADLVNSLVNVYNAQVIEYNSNLKGNKYKMELTTLPLIDKSGKSVKPAGGSTPTVTKKGKFTVKKRG